MMMMMMMMMMIMMMNIDWQYGDEDTSNRFCLVQWIYKNKPDFPFFAVSCSILLKTKINYSSDNLLRLEEILQKGDR